jgi:murein DD-endopeptidase MepM/ murein hydrolase activator NlpD
MYVSQNGSVGKSGQSGNCLPTGGAHLHFELWLDGVRVDPFGHVLFAKMPK